MQGLMDCVCDNQLRITVRGSATVCLNCNVTFDTFSRTAGGVGSEDDRAGDGHKQVHIIER